MSINTLHLRLRNLQASDYPQIQQLMDQVYADLGGAWSQATIHGLIHCFPDGQIGIEDDNQLVGMALTVRVDYATFSNPHTYQDLQDAHSAIRQNPEGDALYGLDVLIHPDYRGYRLGRRLYNARKELCRSLNLRAILAGGRISGYHQYASTLSPSDYIAKIAHRELYDPILSFQLANEFKVKRLLRDYLPEDEQSQGYATLLEWDNIFYAPPGPVLAQRKTHVRVGAVQWQMRQFSSVDSVLQQVEYFVDALSNYRSDFAVFPELFNTPLMGLTDQSDTVAAIRFLAQFTPQFKQEISRMAVAYNINIVAGSLVEVDAQGRLLNIAYLCHRDGRIDSQHKLHITPQERHDWVITGGEGLQVFQTDAARVGILVCYDVEMPELPRLLADQGMDILFVPFWTDTKNGFLRVRNCAQARAIENECYVVICGSVGNLPSIHSLDVQYAQSAVFSPSDFAFPHDAVMSETTPNTEMMMFSDLNLSQLHILRNEGSVTNLKDRRLDLFKLSWLGCDLQ